MALPVQRTYVIPAVPVANVPQFMTDQQTGQNNFLILTPNVLQDSSNESRRWCRCSIPIPTSQERKHNSSSCRFPLVCRPTTQGTRSNRKCVFESRQLSVGSNSNRSWCRSSSSYNSCKICKSA